MRVRVEDPAAPDIAALLEEHLADMASTSPPESMHALDLSGLRAASVIVVAARDEDGELLGIGALKELDPTHGEVKSMRTATHRRGTGVASALLGHLLEEARRRGYARVSLETGADAPFAAAHRLYERFGFEQCPPFSDYGPDPLSRFYTLALE